MLRKLFLGLIIVGLSVVVKAQNVSLVGSIQYHNGVPFNGSLKVSFGKASVLDTCTSPVSVVRNAQISVPVLNGNLSSSAQFIPSSCIGGLPYYVQVFDDKNNNVQNVNWYIIPNSSGTLNAGDMVMANFGGPIVVAVPSPIISNPSGDQTVTQPTSTFLSVNNLAVTNQLVYTGSIAGSISGNAATATQLQNGTSQCSAGYFSTGITQAGNANCSNTWPAATSTFNYATIIGGTGTYTTAAGYFNYNMNGHNRLDSIVNPGSGAGGWAWYKSSNTSTPVADMDLSGNITANSFIGTLIGNAATATSFAVTPAQCSPGQLSTGIDSSGNAHCSSTGTGSRVCNANGCYIVRPDGTIVEWGHTADLGGSSSTFVTFPYTFPSTCSTVTAVTVSGTDRITWVNASSGTTGCTTIGFYVGNNGTGASANWTAIGW